jgi:hypothetical protein
VATARALRNHGIEPLPTIDVAVDLRRYLPESPFTLASFVSVVNVATEPEIRPHQFDQRLWPELESHRPLIAFAARQMIPIVRDTEPSAVVETNRAKLSFNEATGARFVLKKYTWSHSPNPQVWTAIQPLQFSNEITTVIATTQDGAIHMGASFSGDVYAPAIVRRALTDVLSDPYTTARG